MSTMYNNNVLQNINQEIRTAHTTLENPIHIKMINDALSNGDSSIKIIANDGTEIIYEVQSLPEGGEGQKETFEAQAVAQQRSPFSDIAIPIEFTGNDTLHAQNEVSMLAANGLIGLKPKDVNPPINTNSLFVNSKNTYIAPKVPGNIAEAHSPHSNDTKLDNIHRNDNNQSNIFLNPTLSSKYEDRKKKNLEKNRLAVHEYRKKKKDYIKCLENRVTELEEQNRNLVLELNAMKEQHKKD